MLDVVLGTPNAYVYLERNGITDYIDITLDCEALNFIDRKLATGKSTSLFTGGAIKLRLTCENNVLSRINFDIDINYDCMKNLQDDYIKVNASVYSNVLTILTGYLDIKN